MALLSTITPTNPLKCINSPPPKYSLLEAPRSIATVVVCHRKDTKGDRPSSVDRRSMLLGLCSLGMASHASALLAGTAPAVNCHYAKADAAAVEHEAPSLLSTTVPLSVRVRPPAHPKDHPQNFYTLAATDDVPAHDRWLLLPWVDEFLRNFELWWLI